MPALAGVYRRAIAEGLPELVASDLLRELAIFFLTGGADPYDEREPWLGGGGGSTP